MAPIRETPEQNCPNKKQKSTRGTSSGGDNAIFPHWQIPEGSSATLVAPMRMNPQHVSLWKERLMVRLEFHVKGHDEHKPCNSTGSCVEMWGDSCSCPRAEPLV